MTSNQTNFSPESHTENLEGLILDERHRLTKKLHSGAVADIYLAENILFERTVAIKMLKKELHANPDLITRLHQEAQVGAMFHHPNINDTFDFGITPDNRNFIVMTPIDGKTLHETVTTGGALTPAQFKKTFIQICEALDLMHSGGAIHLNLQPKNIMIDSRTGLAILIDFYSAKLNLARKEQMYKLPDYMTISDYINFEQCAEQPVSNRSDIYSLGCVMFFALTGRAPFVATDRAELRSMHLTTPVRTDLLPEQYAPIIAKAMAKNPEERFKSAVEIAALLDK